MQYWSASKARWLETVILKVTRRPDGAVIAYDLACKPNVQADKLKQMQQDAAENPVDRKDTEASLTGLRAKWMKKREVENDQDAEKAEEITPVYRTGQQVEFFSKSLNDWMPTQVMACRKYKCAYFYDLACKRGVEESKIRPSRSASAAAAAAANPSSVSDRTSQPLPPQVETTAAASKEALDEGALDGERYAKRPHHRAESEERITRRRVSFDEDIDRRTGRR